MFSFRVWVVAFCLVGSVLNVTGCDPPYCGRPDYGTCVVACCKLSWNVTGLSSTEMGDKLTAMLKSGGPDGQYELWASQSNQGIFGTVVQGIHYTTTAHYNDTVNFGVVDVTDNSCAVYAFSHSQDFIVNNFAYGDHGQNYKNLESIIQAIDSISFVETDLFGCPNNSTRVHG